MWNRGESLNIYLNNSIVESIFVIVLSTLLAIFGIYYFYFILVLYPILFIVIGVRHGFAYGITTLAISCLSIGYMIDIMTGISMLIAFAPLIVSIIYGIKNRKKAIEVLSISTLVLMVSLMAIIIIAGNVEGVNVIDQIKDAFDQAMDMQIEMLKDYQLTNFEIFQLKSKLENDFKLFLNTIPSIMMITSFIVAYINYLISSLLLRKLGYGVVFIPRFSRFKLPRNIIAGIGIMFIATLLLKGLKIFNFEAVVSNLYVLGFLAFFLQGLSVLDYKLIQKKIGIIFRLFILAITIILSSLISGVLVITGILDVIFDFRKLRNIA